jgi:hypothetical protein
MGSGVRGRFKRVKDAIHAPGFMATTKSSAVGVPVNLNGFAAFLRVDRDPEK